MIPDPASFPLDYNRHPFLCYYYSYDEDGGYIREEKDQGSRHLFTTHHSCFLGVNLMSREGNSRDERSLVPQEIR